MSNANEQFNNVVETELENGLCVLLKEDHSAPIASVWTWYRVGSRNEFPGKTGISHWVEHMQFKGTPTIAKGQIFRDISRVGGTLNALTSQDWTAYFETVPIDHLDLALDIESDRMANSLFDAEEVESERTVILSERQGAENNPGYALYEEVNGTAFQAHPYRHMVIGYESDLRQISRDDLYNHYRRYYHPANAFVVAVGAFDTQDMVKKIESRFGKIAGGEVVPRGVGASEPLQPGERRVLIRKPAGAPYLRMAFHAPDAASGDLPALLVLEAVLSGGQPMGFGGGGAMGRSSRLYRALVASGIVRSVGSDMSITIDPNLFQIGVTGLPGGDLSRVEQVLENELAKLRDEAVTPAEMARAVRQLESQVVYSAEGVTNQAYWLGQWEIVDTWTRARSFLDEIRAVTADDVQRVARQYLLPDRRTIGWLLPDEETSQQTLNEASRAAYRPPLAWGLDGPRVKSSDATAGFRRELLANGVPVLGQDRPDSQSVALRVRIAAGSIYEDNQNSGIAHLTARSAQRGSGGQSFEEISTRTDGLGSSISIDAGRQFVEARVRCLREDLPEMTALLAQTLLQPDFPEDEVERVKFEQRGAISEADNDTRSVADRLLRRDVYPDPNPLGRSVLGTKETVDSLDAGAVRLFHDRSYLPAQTTISVVGGLYGFERALDHLNQAFGSWSASEVSTPQPNLSPINDAVVRASEEIAGKSQADLAVGLATIPRGNEDYYALDVANLILGRLGLMGRLGAEVRDHQGLAYYAFSQIEPRVDGSLWSIRAGVDPVNIERALDAMERELRRLRTELVTEEELRDAKSYLIGVLPLALESHDGVAATLLAIEEYDLGLDFLARYPDFIASVTRESVLAAASSHLSPERRVIALARPH